jgi:hypothetical protein
MSNPTTKLVIRLSAEVYADIEKKVPKIAVTNDTSPMQAGYQLGVQAVLELLRKGYVTE